VKPEKYRWKVREVEFLGVVIGPRGIEMQKEKVEGVLNWPAPKNVKEVQKFLGLANYYRRFIKDFAKISALLHVLVRKEQKWKWEKEQEEAFRRLKEVFTTEPVLAIPDIDREMRVNVMNIEWDYNYYQPWSDNEWLVDEMLAILNEGIIMQ